MYLDAQPFDFQKSFASFLFVSSPSVSYRCCQCVGSPPFLDKANKYSWCFPLLFLPKRLLAACNPASRFRWQLWHSATRLFSLSLGSYCSGLYRQSLLLWRICATVRTTIAHVTGWRQLFTAPHVSHAPPARTKRIYQLISFQFSG